MPHNNFTPDCKNSSNMHLPNKYHISHNTRQLIANKELESTSFAAQILNRSMQKLTSIHTLEECYHLHHDSLVYHSIIDAKRVHIWQYIFLYITLISKQYLTCVGIHPWPQGNTVRNCSTPILSICPHQYWRESNPLLKFAKIIDTEVLHRTVKPMKTLSFLDKQTFPSEPQVHTPMCPIAPDVIFILILHYILHNTRTSIVFMLFGLTFTSSSIGTSAKDSQTPKLSRKTRS